MLTLINLPTELLVYISTFLKPRDIPNLILTCRTFRNICLLLSPTGKLRIKLIKNPNYCLRNTYIIPSLGTNISHLNLISNNNDIRSIF